jgi:hypothetical protein
LLFALALLAAFAATLGATAGGSALGGFLLPSLLLLLLSLLLGRRLRGLRRRLLGLLHRGVLGRRLSVTAARGDEGQARQERTQCDPERDQKERPRQ